MNKTLIAGVAALLSLAVPALLTGPALAQEKHDSNTLHKLGKAIEYPIRKTSTNASITAHRTVGKNSVARRKNGAYRHNTIITPKGHLHRIHHRRYRTM